MIDAFLAVMSIVSTSIGILILLSLGKLTHKNKYNKQPKDYHE